jgi:predicted dehydrogenase
MGWTLTKVVTGDKRETIDYAPASSVLANVEAFADAVEGRAAYPMPQGEMLANIAALEAIIASARSGERVLVP